MNRKNENSERFLTTYNELDKYMRKYLKENERIPHSELIRKMTKVSRIFIKHEYELRQYADLRNSIVHNPDKGYADPIAEPHDYIVSQYENIKNKVLNPPVALDHIAIKANNIFTTTLNSNALNVMKQMNENTFTHVPVIEDGKIIGVFSEDTIFSYITKDQGAIIDECLLIKDFADFLPFSNHQSEYYEFVPKNTLVIDIEEIFRNGIKDKKRISVIFVTEKGRQNEKLLGLITVWDLAGYER